MRATIAIACAASVLAAPAAAEAHVTLQPDEVPAGGFSRLDVRVPNERDDASTTKVQVKFPPGFIFASTEPVPGWTAKVTRTKLAEPISEHGEQITDRVDTVTWTGDGDQGSIAPGEFRDFGLSVGVPEEAGKSLTFKAVQTYDSGEVVRWIGAADADEPAPQVHLAAAAAAEEEDHGAAGEAEAEVEPAASVGAGGDDDDDGAPTWLAVLALVVGGLGLAAGVGGLAAARRRPA